MQFSKEFVNQVSNIAGTFVGVPEIISGVLMITAGDYLSGSLTATKGIALFVGFYLVGK